MTLLSIHGRPTLSSANTVTALDDTGTTCTSRRPVFAVAVNDAHPEPVPPAVTPVSIHGLPAASNPTSAFAAPVTLAATKPERCTTETDAFGALPVALLATTEKLYCALSTDSFGGMSIVSEGDEPVVGRPATAGDVGDSDHANVVAPALDAVSVTAAPALATFDVDAESDAVPGAPGIVGPQVEPGCEVLCVPAGATPIGTNWPRSVTCAGAGGGAFAARAS